MLDILGSDKYNNYWAHISENKTETLYEHTGLVIKYFKNILEAHHLEPLIDKLIKSLVEEKSFDFVKSIFMAIPEYHDIGKINPDFQALKMKNPDFKRHNFSFSSEHSNIGAFLFIQRFVPLANDEKLIGIEKILNVFILFSFSFSIKKHHSSTLDVSKEYDFESDFIKDLYSFLNSNVFNVFPQDVQKNIKRMFNEKVLPGISKVLIKDKFSLFALLKLNYSLLTASDYLATTHFMNDWGDELLNDFGVFNDDLKKKIIENIEASTSYNRETYNKSDNYLLEFPKEKSNDNLNILRQNLSVEIITGIRKNIDKNLFYIEAPTGSGKTNLSMLALAEFLRNDINTGQNSITKVFYVFPFTTLITQTFESLKETLGLEDDEIVQLHSKAGFSQKGSDDKYGKDKLNIIDYQFVNYPVALLSHIKFFDILKSNRKSANYLMHRLANSVVIIDELQTYSPREWDKVIYFINQYAKYFNIKFIMMSATLPKIDELLSDESEGEFEKEAFVKLNQNKEKYFQNPNFADRIEFDFSMLNSAGFKKEKKEEFLKKLWNKLVEESKKYKNKSKDSRVHTIIEFIFKKTASEFIEIANEKNNFFDEIFILSGTILEPRRREIINKLKSEEFKQKNILLITTQVVEAGVDIDMDLGFKDSSLIDSDEQLAGRINRNVKKPECKLFLFDYDDASIIYGKDYRFKLTKEKIEIEKYRSILQSKNFDMLYSLVMEHITEDNEQEGFTDNLPAYIKSIKNLDFELVHKEFQLINNSFPTTSIFIPVEIPILIPNSNEENFNDEELRFLREKGKYNNEDYVSGENVWDLYCDIIENKDNDFTKKKVQQLIMQGLVSKFSISVNTFSKDFKSIVDKGSGEDKYGFYKLNYHDEVYDYDTGIKVKEIDAAIIF